MLCRETDEVIDSRSAYSGRNFYSDGEEPAAFFQQAGE